ncbi:MAG: antibiotic biosynthesis monooxygenase [Actinobacteria bacterium]|nr:antibiotic biosynthesis monooxygenase [Actinomycetota bacterium]
MSKVSAVAKLVVKDGTGDEFPAAFDDLFEHIAEHEDGTQHYVLHRSTKDPNVFYMTEIYLDQAALDEHSKSEPFAGLAGALGAFVESVDLDFCTPVKVAKA